METFKIKHASKLEMIIENLNEKINNQQIKILVCASKAEMEDYKQYKNDISVFINDGYVSDINDNYIEIVLDEGIQPIKKLLIEDCDGDSFSAYPYIRDESLYYFVVFD